MSIFHSRNLRLLIAGCLIVAGGIWLLGWRQYSQPSRAESDSRRDQFQLAQYYATNPASREPDTAIAAGKPVGGAAGRNLSVSSGLPTDPHRDYVRELRDQADALKALRIGTRERYNRLASGFAGLGIGLALLGLILNPIHRNRRARDARRKSKFDDLPPVP